MHREHCGKVSPLEGASACYPRCLPSMRTVPPLWAVPDLAHLPLIPDRAPPSPPPGYQTWPADAKEYFRSSPPGRGNISTGLPQAGPTGRTLGGKASLLKGTATQQKQTAGQVEADGNSLSG